MSTAFVKLLKGYDVTEMIKNFEDKYPYHQKIINYLHSYLPNGNEIKFYLTSSPIYSPYADHNAVVFHPFHIDTMPIEAFTFHYAHELGHILRDNEKDRRASSGKNNVNNMSIAHKLTTKFTTTDPAINLKDFIIMLPQIPSFIKEKVQITKT